MPRLFLLVRDGALVLTGTAPIGSIWFHYAGCSLRTGSQGRDGMDDLCFQKLAMWIL